MLTIAVFALGALVILRWIGAFAYWDINMLVLTFVIVLVVGFVVAMKLGELYMTEWTEIEHHPIEAWDNMGEWRLSGKFVLGSGSITGESYKMWMVAFKRGNEIHIREYNALRTPLVISDKPQLEVIRHYWGKRDKVPVYGPWGLDFGLPTLQGVSYKIHVPKDGIAPLPREMDLGDWQ